MYICTCIYIYIYIYLGATPSFHRLLSRSLTRADSWGPLGPLGDPLGTLWGALGKPLGTLGIPRGFLGDPLGTTWRPQEMSWGPLGTPRRSLGDHLPGSLVTLGASWGSLGASWTSKGVQEASWGALGIIFEASKVFVMQFAAICKNLQIYCKVLQNSRSRETEIIPNQTLFCSKSSPNC